MKNTEIMRNKKPVSSFFSCLLSLILTFIMIPCCYAEIASPSKTEVIDEVANFTGLTKDAVSLVLEENPKALEQLGDTVLALKILNAFSEARDTEALSDIMDYGVGKLVDKLKEKTFPGSMNVFFTAFSVYKTSLELIRDYYYVPKFDEKMYSRYREMRLDDIRRRDMSPESKTSAFEAATTGEKSGYYVVKTRMFDAMIKAKGYNRDQMGEKTENDLWKKIDKFWMARFEAKLQQNILKERKKDLERQIWDTSSQALALFKESSSGLGAPRSFFFSESRPPAGWKVSRLPDSLKEITPQYKEQMNFTTQNFRLYPENVVEKLHPDGTSAQHYTPGGKYIDSDQKRWIYVSIYITPSTYVIKQSGYRIDMKKRLSDLGKQGELSSLMRITGEFNEAGAEIGYVAQEQYKGEWRRNYQCRFIKGSWDVNIETTGHPNFMAQDKEALIEIAKEVAARIPAKGKP